MIPAEGHDPAHDDERFSLGSGGPLIAYEHLHRYALAARVAAGRRVLDLACGTGYGSRMLAASGASVVALDLARVGLREVKDGVCGSAAALPFAEASFDLVVCFEAIEHLASPAAVVEEIYRVLTPDGVALISTPDRSVYSDRAGLSNAHHVSEMTRQDFEGLLRARFGGVVCYGQSVWAGSWISRLPSGRSVRGGTRKLQTLIQDIPGGSEAAQRAPWAGEAPGEPPEPLYLIALCSREAGSAAVLARNLGADSVLHDPRQWLLGGYFAATRAVVDRDREIESQQRHALNLDAELQQLRQRPPGDAEHLVRLQAAYEFELRERSSVAQHAENLALLLAGAWRHGGNLARLWSDSERERLSVAAHARNLELELAELRQLGKGDRAHARNLELELADLLNLRKGDRTHARNLEFELADLRNLRKGDRAHARNLELELVHPKQRVLRLEAHAANLEAELFRVQEHRDALLVHAANVLSLSAQRGNRIKRLEEHIANIEAERERLSRHREGLFAHVENLERGIARERELRGGVQRHADNLEALLLSREREFESLVTARDGLAAERDRLTHQLEVQRREADLSRLRLETRLARTALDLEHVEGEVERLRSSVWFRALRQVRLLK